MLEEYVPINVLVDRVSISQRFRASRCTQKVINLAQAGLDMVGPVDGLVISHCKIRGLW